MSLWIFIDVRTQLLRINLVNVVFSCVCVCVDTIVPFSYIVPRWSCVRKYYYFPTESYLISVCVILNILRTLYYSESGEYNDGVYYYRAAAVRSFVGGGVQ